MKVRSKIVKSIIVIACLFLLPVLYITQFVETSDIISSLNPTSVELDSPIHKSALADSIWQLTIDNIFWTHRIRMAKTESIDLLIDLMDNKVLLELQGVTIYTSTIYNYNYSDSLLDIQYDDRLLFLLKKKFILEQEWSSIAKEPIQIRDIGPRANGENILTHFRNPEDKKEIHIHLNFSNTLAVIFMQVESNPDSLNSIKIPSLDPKYQLEIYLSRNAAKTIYRAVKTGRTSLALRTR